MWVVSKVRYFSVPLAFPCRDCRFLTGVHFCSWMVYLASGQYHLASAEQPISTLGLLCLFCPSQVFLATGQTVWGFRVSGFRFLDFQSRIYRAHGSKFNRCATAKFMKLLGLGNKVWGTGWAASVCPTPEVSSPGQAAELHRSFVPRLRRVASRCGASIGGHWAFVIAGFRVYRFGVTR